MHWFEIEGPFPVDYFIGGLITGGLAFQPSGTLSEAPSFDAQIGRWAETTPSPPTPTPLIFSPSFPQQRGPVAHQVDGPVQALRPRT